MSRNESRQEIVHKKRAIAKGCIEDAHQDARLLAKDSAVWLLGRSITFGHRRLAVIRLHTAVQAGAEIPDHYLDYCNQVASSSCDEKIRTMVAAVARMRGASVGKKE